MVFQNYALFPHLSVERNIAFGLEMRRTPRSEIPDRVRKAMVMVRLDPSSSHCGCRPSSPAVSASAWRSHGRWCWSRPILLLDEPLGALDLKLRKEMQPRAQTPEPAARHDVHLRHPRQEEALTMSDRIAVMSNARIAQLGTPAETYENPRTEFVARFIGESNFFEGVAGRTHGRRVDGRGRRRGPVSSSRSTPRSRRWHRLQIAVRPEWISTCVAATTFRPAGNAIAGHVREVIYLGETLHVLSPSQGAAPRPSPCARGPAPPAAVVEDRRRGRRGVETRRLPGLGAGLKSTIRQRWLVWFHTRPTAQVSGLLAARWVWLLAFFRGPAAVHVRLQLHAAEPVRRRGRGVHARALRAVRRPRVRPRSSVRTTAYALGCTALCLLLGYPVAYAIARGGRWKNFLLFLIVLPFWTSFLVRTFAMIFLMRDTGLINDWLIKLGVLDEPIQILYTPTAVMIGLVYGFLPFMVLPIYASLEKLDLSLLEAAEVLGARATLAVPARNASPLDAGCDRRILAGVFIPALGSFLTSDLLGGAKLMMIGNLVQNQFTTARTGRSDRPHAFALMTLVLIAVVILPAGPRTRNRPHEEPAPAAVVDHLRGRRSTRCCTHPLLVLVVFSFNASKFSAEWTGFTFRWYQRLLERTDILEGLGASVLVGLVSTIISTLLGTLSALALARHRFWGRQLVEGAALRAHRDARDRPSGSRC
jgi:spermidine/putrescine transport system permease protein